MQLCMNSKCRWTNRNSWPSDIHRSKWIACHWNKTSLGIPVRKHYMFSRSIAFSLLFRHTPVTAILLLFDDIAAPLSIPLHSVSFWQTVGIRLHLEFVAAQFSLLEYGTDWMWWAKPANIESAWMSTLNWYWHRFAQLLTSTAEWCETWGARIGKCRKCPRNWGRGLVFDCS